MTVHVKGMIAMGLSVGLLLGHGTVAAHGDEDHGGSVKAASAPAMAAAPRATAQSEDFELVATLAKGKLTLTLDHFATNAPIAGAKVEVDGEGLQGIATETATGVYAMDARGLTNTPPGAKVSLTIAIEAGDISDLISTTLTLPAAAASAGVVHVHSWTERAGWLFGGAVALAGLALLAIRRRKQHKESR